jgi:hypothetical protein
MSNSIPSLPASVPVVNPGLSAAASASATSSTPPAASPGPSATQLPGTSATPPSSGGCQNCGGKNSGKAKKEKKGGGLFAGLFGLIGGFFKMLFGGGRSKKPKQNSNKN